MTLDSEIDSELQKILRLELEKKDASFDLDMFDEFKQSFKRFKHLEKKIKSGDQILIVKEEEIQRYKDLGLFGIETKLEWELGVLDSWPKLDFGEDLTFPTEKYAEKKIARHTEEGWSLKEGPISLTCYDLLNLGKEIPRRVNNQEISSFSGPHSSLMIHSGEEVGQYFEENRRRHSNFYSYLEALNLLKVEPSEKFRKKYDEEIYKEEIKLIDKLEKLSEREKELNSKIGDSSEMAFLTIERRGKLGETKREIQEYLRKGLKLGMHERDSRIHLRPGIDVNVPVYISGMCEKYKVNS